MKRGNGPNAKSAAKVCGANTPDPHTSEASDPTSLRNWCRGD